jgi:hypothetical protein
MTKKYFKSFDDIVDHCRYVWITRSSISTVENNVHRARGGQPGSGSAANASVGAGGRSKKFKTVSAPGVATVRF